MKSDELSHYLDLLGEIKDRVRQAQHRAILSANADMLFMYWDIGRMIAARQKREGWGKGLLARLAIDLRNEIPEIKGFSERNLQMMVQFQGEYPELFLIPQRGVAELEPPEMSSEIMPSPAITTDISKRVSIMQRTVAQLSWAHNIILIQKLKDRSIRLWYAQQTLEQGWSRDVLAVQIKNHAYERQGAAVTNFATTLPEIHANLVRGLLKDPYLFDFLTLEEPYHERELETGLLSHIQKFLLELGRGFAFVGRQYRLEVSDRELYLDLLFYHLHLRCFVVIELKKGDFRPEYAGKMNFYCSVVDDQLRQQHDKPTLGLILCQTKDRILAEYALRDIHKPIGVADYELTRALPKELASSLPSIEDIEAELSESLKDDVE